MQTTKKTRDGRTCVQSAARREAEREWKRHRAFAKRILTQKGYEIPGYVEWMRGHFSNPRTSAYQLLDDLKFLRWLTDHKLGAALGCAERGCPSTDFAELRQRESCLLREIDDVRATFESSSIDEWRSLFDSIFDELVRLDRDVLHAIESYEASHKVLL